MTQPVSEPTTGRSIGYGQWRTNQLERRPPTGGGETSFWWSIISDGYVGTNSGTTYPIGSQYYGTNDVEENYYSYTQRNQTYPVFGSTDYFTVEVNETGLYLLDAQLTIDSWSVTNCYAELDLNPNLEAWYPFGSGTNENDAWIDRHITHDATNGQINSFFRVTGIASLQGGTEFFPSFRQVSGTNNLVASFNYFKIVRLQLYEDIADLRTGAI